MSRVLLMTLVASLAVPSVAVAQFGDPAGLSDFRDRLKEQADLNRINEQLLRQFAEGTKQYSQEMSALRARFWAAYPNGQGIREISAEFSRQLWIKDLAFLMAGALPEGTDTIRSALMNNLLSALDGGIPTSARANFNLWAKAVRWRLGATGDQVLFPNPVKVFEAIAATEAEYERYRIDRDFAEFDRAGREPAWITDTPSYIASLYFRYGRLDIESARREATTVAAIFGQSQVLRAAERIRKAPKKEGLLTDVTSLGLLMQVSNVTRTAAELRSANQPLPGNTRVVSSHSPLAAFRVMLVASADHPKTYLLAAMGLHGGHDGWNAVTSEYRAMGRRLRRSRRSRRSDSRHEGAAVLQWKGAGSGQSGERLCRSVCRVRDGRLPHQ